MLIRNRSDLAATRGVQTDLYATTRLLLREDGVGLTVTDSRGERFRFVAHEPTRLICVFTPALVGPEVSDADGSFPLLDDAGGVVAA